MQVTDLEILLQYRNSELKQWTDVAVDGCMYSPEPNFLIGAGTWVSFDTCQLAEAIPAGSTVLVTAKVKIYGRIKGVGKTDVWFLSRLSQSL